jgi:molybdopterin synthase catalytic subunit
MHAANVGVGAVVGFVGYVRDFNDGRTWRGCSSSTIRA